MCDKVTPGGLRITVKNTACRGDSTGGTADRVVVNSNISTPSSDVKRGECNAAAFSPVRAVAAARQLSNALNGIAATERSTGRGDETTRVTPASSCIWPLPTTLQPGKIKQPIKMLPLLCLTLWLGERILMIWNYSWFRYSSLSSVPAPSFFSSFWTWNNYCFTALS